MYKTLSEMRAELMGEVPGFAPNTYNDTIQRAYDSVNRCYPWQDMEVESNLSTVEVVDTGGAHFENGATDVTASTTVSAAWSAGESNGFAGRFISKQDDASYWSITASDSVSVTIETAYAGKTTTAAASSGDSYAIFKHIYTVDTSIDTVRQVMCEYDPLEDITGREIEQRDADFWEKSQPSRFRNIGRNSANVTMIQLFPALIDDVYSLRIRGSRRAETLTDTTKPLLDSDLIMAVALVKLLRKKRVVSPNTVTQDMVTNAIDEASYQMECAVERDRRGRTSEPYVRDKMFGEIKHPGQRRIVAYDPWDL